MYTRGDMVYASPGYFLKGKGSIGYQIKGDISEFQELPVILDDIKLIGTVVVYNNGLMRHSISKSTSYGELKSKFIKMRYSNDDQIAILLNKDESYDRYVQYMQMQEWREWSAILAKAILNVINNE